MSKVHHPLHLANPRIPGLERAFGATLRRLRTSQHISQEEFAIEMGMDRTYISLLERGLRRPSLATVFQIAQRFGMTPSALIQQVETEMENL